VSDLGGALAATRYGSLIALVAGGVSVLNGWATVGVWSIAYAALFAAGAFGLYRASRVAAVATLLLFLVDGGLCSSARGKRAECSHWLSPLDSVTPCVGHLRTIGYPSCAMMSRRNLTDVRDERPNQRMHPTAAGVDDARPRVMRSR
jgi:hypothetical protein